MEKGQKTSTENILEYLERKNKYIGMQSASGREGRGFLWVFAVV